MSESTADVLNQPPTANRQPLIRWLGRVEYEPTWRARQALTDARDATTPDEIWFRVQISDAELSDPNARYFYQGYYVFAKEAESVRTNNGQSREFRPSGSGSSWSFSPHTIWVGSVMRCSHLARCGSKRRGSQASFATRPAGRSSPTCRRRCRCCSISSARSTAPPRR